MGIKFVIENLSVLSKPHEKPVCFVTMNLTVSVQLSKFLSPLNINFDLLSPVQSLLVTGIVAVLERAPTVTVSGTVTFLSPVPLLSVIANKTTLRLSVHCPDVSVCHVNSSSTSDCTPHCSSHDSPNKMHDCSHS